jgi:hypothetical protein
MPRIATGSGVDEASLRRSLKTFLLWVLESGRISCRTRRCIAPIDQQGRTRWFGSELLFNEWRTNESGASDAAGKFQTRGFKGEYNVMAPYARIEKTITVNLGNNGEVGMGLDVSALLALLNHPSGRPTQKKEKGAKPKKK